MGAPYQKRSVLQRQLKDLSKKIVDKSLIITDMENGGFFAGYMIHKIWTNPKENALYAECDEYFTLLFSQAGKEFARYVSYMVDDFVSLKGKYEKNLFRLFSKNFKGHFVIAIDDLKKELNISEKVDNGGVFRRLKLTCTNFISLGYYENITITPIVGFTQGRPLKAVEFTFTRSPEKSAELAGQEQLPGLADDGAALPPKQAAPGGEAAPAPMPPAAAEKPLLTGEGLIKPSYEQILQAITADGLALPSGNAGGGKRAAPEIPPCPVCGGEMGIRNGKNGWFLYCKHCPKTMSGKPLQKMGLCFDQEGRLSWL